MLIPYRNKAAVPKGRDAWTSAHRDLDHFFDDLWGLSRERPDSGLKAFTPQLEVLEKDSEYVVNAELPGLEQKDIDIQLEGDVLRIKGEKKEEHEVKEKAFYKSERSFGAFERQVYVPSELVEADKVKASFKNGVLNIQIPKRAEAVKTTKKIPIA